MALYHSAKGSVDYTIVGSPTIVDGVVSDFSSSNLLQINNFDPSKPFVISTKIRFTATGERQYFVGVNTSGKIRIIIFTDQKLLCNLGGASNFNIGEIKSTQELSTNTDYFVKLEFTGSKYILSLSEDNVVYSIIGEIVSSAYINGGNTFNLQLGSGNLPTTGFYFRGFIDLNHTYITVEGQPWFGICPIEVKKHQIMGPVGYELSGNATVTDGILTSVNLSSTCLTPSLPSTFNTMEFMFKVAYPNPGSGAFIPICGFGGQGSARRISASPSSGNRLLYSGSGEVIVIPNSDFNVISAFTQTGGYYVRLFVKKNTSDYTYTLGCSLDKNTWVEKTETITDNICYGALSLLRNSGGTSNGRPQMDLNETYVKVDGKIWFWQPQETKYIVKDGKLVWADPRIYLQSDGSGQYIQTNIHTTGDTEVSTSFSVAQIETLSSIFSSRTSYSVANFGLSSREQGILTAYYNNSSIDIPNFTVQSNRRTYIDMIKNNISVDNINYGTIGNYTSFTAQTPLRFFALSTTTPSYFLNGKLYRTKIVNGNNKYDFVPVPEGLQIGNYTVPSNGMFDIVNQQFYANQGPGNFTIGRDK